MFLSSSCTAYHLPHSYTPSLSSCSFIFFPHYCSSELPTSFLWLCCVKLLILFLFSVFYTKARINQYHHSFSFSLHKQEHSTLHLFPSFYNLNSFQGGVNNLNRNAKPYILVLTSDNRKSGFGLIQSLVTILPLCQIQSNLVVKINLKK